MENIRKILNSYTVSGSDYEEFKEKNAEMAEITKIVAIRGNDLTLFSFCDLPRKQQEGKTPFFVLSEENISSFLLNGDDINDHVGTIPTAEYGESLNEELVNTSGLMMSYMGEKYLVSSLALPTLTLRSSVSGDFTIKRNNIIRDMHFADALFSRNELINFIYREVEITGEDKKKHAVKKVFAAMGGYYNFTPQTILSDIADRIVDEKVLGEPMCRSWSIDHEYTRLYLEFPDVAEDMQEMYKIAHPIVPGIILSTSDIGRSSIKVCSVFRTGNSYVISDELKFLHKGKVETNEIVAAIDQKIFDKVRRLPETLEKLIGFPIMDYGKVDLSSKTGAETNFAVVNELMEQAVEKILKPVIPFKTCKALLECLRDEISSDIHIRYTYYDVAITFLGIPERVVNLDDTTLTCVRKACATAPYILEKMATKKEKEIYLLPE